MSTQCRVPADVITNEILSREQRIEELNLIALTLIQDFCGDPQVSGVEFGMRPELSRRLVMMPRHKLINLARNGESAVQIRPWIESSLQSEAVDWEGRALLRGLSEGRAPCLGESIR